MTPILQDRRNLQRTLSNWKIDVVTRQGPPGDCYRFLWSKATHATLPSSEKEALLGIIPQFSSPCTLPPTSKTLCHDPIRIQKDKCQFIKFVKFNFLGWRANEEKKRKDLAGQRLACTAIVFITQVNKIPKYQNEHFALLTPASLPMIFSHSGKAWEGWKAD